MHVQQEVGMDDEEAIERERGFGEEIIDERGAMQRLPAARRAADGGGANGHYMI